MIYCNLKGGLGNMIFQIIAAKSFAYDIGVECSFPNLYEHLIYLNNENDYNSKLKHSFEYIEKLDLFKNLNTLGPTTKIPFLNFKFHYEKNDFFLLKNNLYINGFFQSEKFFFHNRQLILEWLKIPSDIKQTINKNYYYLLDKKTTAIHVRRGDYIKLPNHHTVQSLEYYLKGIDLLKNKTDLFVIFSDDIEWCKNNLNLPNSVYIENEKDYIELYLMSLCKNNITSNSSFSWWGAWLNENKDKIVIGPSKWFGSEITEKSNDILPDSWIKF